MEGYRVATPKDYGRIVDELNAKKTDSVLLHSRLLVNKKPFSLLDVCRGPFVLKQDRIVARSKDGVQYELSLSNDDSNHLEIRAMDGDWQPPEMGKVQILIKADKGWLLETPSN
jgi:hypothetical protein